MVAGHLWNLTETLIPITIKCIVLSTRHRILDCINYLTTTYRGDYFQTSTIERPWPTDNDIWIPLYMGGTTTHQTKYSALKRPCKNIITIEHHYLIDKLMNISFHSTKKNLFIYLFINNFCFQVKIVYNFSLNKNKMLKRKWKRFSARDVIAFWTTGK